MGTIQIWPFSLLPFNITVKVFVNTMRRKMEEAERKVEELEETIIIYTEILSESTDNEKKFGYTPDKSLTEKSITFPK